MDEMARHGKAQLQAFMGAEGEIPQRFAQEALGHTSRAVHEAYARGAVVICPPLDEYETFAVGKIVPLPTDLPQRPSAAGQC
jgi:hypothetical protein